VLIAEKILGRELKFYGLGDPRNEEVHHISGVKNDNRHCNLMICTREYHLDLHMRLNASAAWPEFIHHKKRGKSA